MSDKQFPRLSKTRASDAVDANGVNLEDRFTSVDKRLDENLVLNQVELFDERMTVQQALLTLERYVKSIDASSIPAKSITKYAPPLNSEGTVSVSSSGASSFVSLSLALDTEENVTRVSTRLLTRDGGSMQSSGLRPMFKVSQESYPVLVTTSVSIVHKGNPINYVAENSITSGQVGEYTQPLLMPTRTVDANSETQSEFNSNLERRLTVLGQRFSSYENMQIPGTAQVPIPGKGLAAAVSSCVGSCSSNASAIQDLKKEIESMKLGSEDCKGRCD